MSVTGLSKFESNILDDITSGADAIISSFRKGASSVGEAYDYAFDTIPRMMSDSYIANKETMFPDEEIDSSLYTVHFELTDDETGESLSEFYVDGAYEELFCDPDNKLNPLEEKNLSNAIIASKVFDKESGSDLSIYSENRSLTSFLNKIFVSEVENRRKTSVSIYIEDSKTKDDIKTCFASKKVDSIEFSMIAESARRNDKVSKIMSKALKLAAGLVGSYCLYATTASHYAPSHMVTSWNAMASPIQDAFLTMQASFKGLGTFGIAVESALTPITDLAKPFLDSPLGALGLGSGVLAGATFSGVLMASVNTKEIEMIKKSRELPSL